MKAIKMLLLAGVAMICACQPSPKSTACKKLLLLVDVQYDFITGSLAVEGAPAVMDGLAELGRLIHGPWRLSWPGNRSRSA